MKNLFEKIINLSKNYGNDLVKAMVVIDEEDMPEVVQHEPRDSDLKITQGILQSAADAIKQAASEHAPEIKVSIFKTGIYPNYKSTVQISGCYSDCMEIVSNAIIIQQDSVFEFLEYAAKVQPWTEDEEDVIYDMRDNLFVQIKQLSKYLIAYDNQQSANTISGDSHVVLFWPDIPWEQNNVL